MKQIIALMLVFAMASCTKDVSPIPEPSPVVTGEVISVNAVVTEHIDGNESFWKVEISLSQAVEIPVTVRVKWIGSGELAEKEIQIAAGTTTSTYITEAAITPGSVAEDVRIDDVLVTSSNWIFQY